MKILVINSGSYSIKYKLFDMPSERLVRKGAIEHIGEDGSRFSNHYSGLKIILEKTKLVQAVGHRVVHGAEDFNKPALVDQSVIKGIKK